MTTANELKSGEFKSGWPTIVACATGACAGLTGLAFYTFGLFVKPLSAAFGWSRGQITLGLSFITLGTIVLAPLVGWMIDRWGVPRVAAPSLVGSAIAFALLSRTGSNIGAFYAGCLGIAVLGCATAPTSWTRAICLRFTKTRGLALGLTLLGSAMASLVGVPVVQWLISHHGWQAGYLGIAGFSAVVAFPVVLLLLGRQPGQAQAAAAPIVSGLTLPQTLRTGAFWTLAIGVLMLITAQSGVTIHLVPMLTDRGLPAGAAAGIAGLMGLAVFVSRIAVGALLDRFSPSLVAGLTLLAPVAAAVILALCGTDRTALVAVVVLLGMSAGAEMDFLSFFAARHFGMRAYGRIYGCLFAMLSLGNGLGAPVMGAIFDKTGSYQPALWGAAVLFAGGAALFASLAWHRPWSETPVVVASGDVSSTTRLAAVEANAAG